MIGAKYKAGITADQWRSNASYNIFLEASHAANTLRVYKVTRILSQKTTMWRKQKVPLSHLCLWSIQRRHLLNWLGITTGWHILWEVQIYWRRSSGPTETTVPKDLKISGTFSPAEISNDILSSRNLEWQRVHMDI